MQWTMGVGGVYTDTCQHDDVLWLAGHHQVLRLQLDSESGPQVTRVVKRRHDGMIHLKGRARCSSDAFFWPESSPKAEASKTAAAQALSAGARTFEPKAGHIFTVSGDGWAYTIDGQLESGRRQVVGLRDAVIKGESLWVLSDAGLWRMELDTQRVLPIALPAKLLEARPTSFFQDGRAFWITTKDGRAWPVQVMGSYAHPMAPPGKVAPSVDGIRLPVQNGVLEWQRRGGPLEVLNRRKDTLFSRPSVDAILPLHAQRVLVSSKDRIEVLHVSDDAVTVAQTISMPGRTVRLFLWKQALVAVGPDYGVLLGTLVNSVEKTPKSQP